VGWAVASRRLPSGPRRAALVATIMLACGVFTLLRTGGLSGEDDSDTRKMPGKWSAARPEMPGNAPSCIPGIFWASRVGCRAHGIPRPHRSTWPTTIFATADLVQALHEHDFPLSPSGGVGTRFPRPQMRQHDGRERVCVSFQPGWLPAPIEQLGNTVANLRPEAPAPVAKCVRTPVASVVGQNGQGNENLLRSGRAGRTGRCESPAIPQLSIPVTRG
jgi:hypothetical protein